MDHALTMAEWEHQQCASTQMNGGPAAGIWALDVWRSLMPSCGRFDSRSGRQSREEKHYNGMERQRWQSLATHKPQFDEQHTSSRANVRDYRGGSIEARRLSSPMASQPRFTGSQDTLASPETKKQTIRQTWPETQVGTR